jgi:DNA modification methylase
MKDGSTRKPNRIISSALKSEPQADGEVASPIRIRDRIKELRRVRARDLLPNPHNWRRHPQSQTAALRGLLEEVGYADALLARELPNGQLELIDGHLRAQTTPDQIVPVLVLDLNEQEAKLVLLTLDPLASLAEAEAEQIKALLEMVRTENVAVQELLEQVAGPKAWTELHCTEQNDPQVPLERADELQAKWRTTLGQVWKIDRHRLGCGDSGDRSLVAQLWSDNAPSIRMLWTDPPYGVSYGAKTDWTSHHRPGSKRRAIENDSLEPAELQKLFASVLQVARDHTLPGAAIYASVPSVFLKYFIQGLEDGGFTYRHCLIWLKQTFVLGRSDYHYRHEPILYGWLDNGPHYFSRDRSQDSVLDVDRPIVSDLHPTTKPIELIARMLANSSRPGELVFDPFCGSGSTILAAHQLGRIGYGCELDPGYLAVQLERLSMLGLKPELKNSIEYD